MIASLLTPFEKKLCEEYELDSFLSRNTQFLIFVKELKKSILAFQKDENLKITTWNPPYVANFVNQFFLTRSEHLFNYVCEKYRELKGGKDVPKDIWEQICRVFSKVTLEAVWKAEEI